MNQSVSLSAVMGINFNNFSQKVRFSLNFFFFLKVMLKKDARSVFSPGIYTAHEYSTPHCIAYTCIHFIGNVATEIIGRSFKTASVFIML